MLLDDRQGLLDDLERMRQQMDDAMMDAAGGGTGGGLVCVTITQGEEESGLDE